MHALFQVAADTTQAAAGPFDSTWAQTATQAASGLDAVMLSNDKLYVVVTVVLIIWLGLLLFVFRTDRKLDRLERTVEAGIPPSDA